MLSEVYTLEKLRHFNIVEYKHCWLEDHKLTKFGKVIANKRGCSTFTLTFLTHATGPRVPCLFILMELANGGNLEEYVMKNQLEEPSGSLSPTELAKERFKSLRKRRKSESSGGSKSPVGTDAESEVQGRTLNEHEIWCFFLDVCAGLDHLHRHGKSILTIASIAYRCLPI
jgi:serine/threonine protein kinase